MQGTVRDVRLEWLVGVWVTSQYRVGELVDFGARRLHSNSISTIYYVFNLW